MVSFSELHRLWPSPRLNDTDIMDKLSKELVFIYFRLFIQRLYVVIFQESPYKSLMFNNNYSYLLSQSAVPVLFNTAATIHLFQQMHHVVVLILLK